MAARVEVVTGSHSTAEALRYADVAREFDLLASRGSDFHSPVESHIDLGHLPPLPADLPTVWSRLAERIHAASVGFSGQTSSGAHHKRQQLSFS
jgi:hypothetical protein